MRLTPKTRGGPAGRLLCSGRRFRLVASPIPAEAPASEVAELVWEKELSSPPAADSNPRAQRPAPQRGDSAISEPTCRSSASIANCAANPRRREPDRAGQRRREALAVEQRRDLYDPGDPRLRAAQGKRFEERVADLLRLLGYRVEAEQTLDGNRVHLVATLKQGLDRNELPRRMQGPQGRHRHTGGRHPRKLAAPAGRRPRRRRAA